MSFTEQDMKKQIEDFTALREEFFRLESQEKAMRKQLDLPEHLSTNALLEVLNVLMTREAFRNLCK